MQPKLQLPGSHISQTCHISPFLSVQVSGVHTGCLWAGNKTQTGNQGVLWGCRFGLQEKLGHTPIVPWLLCSPTVVTVLERHILICFNNYLYKSLYTLVVSIFHINKVCLIKPSERIQLNPKPGRFNSSAAQGRRR